MRFMVLANEPPLFQDASGAIVTRFVFLQTTSPSWTRRTRR